MRYWIMAAALAGLTGPALAQIVSTDRSEYSRLENCQDRDPGDLAPYLEVCEGPQGRDIWLPYSEHSSAMAIGPNGIEAQFDERPVIGGLNMTIGPVIDWRYAEGEDRPYAAIVRYRGMTPEYDPEAGDFTGRTEINDNVLVVMALRDEGPVSACHVAYIDAAEIPGANEVAFRLTARYANNFRCGQSEIMVIDLLSAESLGLTD